MARTTRDTDPFEVLRTRLKGLGELLDKMDAAAAEGLIRHVLRARRVFITGKGRSGLVASCFAMRLMQMGLDVHVPGEATCPRIRRRDLMLAVSCSGTTSTTVQLAHISREAGARVVAVTAAPGSPLAELADLVVAVPVATPDMKKRYRDVLGPYNNTLFEEALLVFFDAVVYAMLERQGIPKRRLAARHTNLE